MNQELLYLRADVQVEPLFDSWYAWPYLIAPATAARYVTDRHLKIMDSYIAAPQFHASALQDPKMIGGPFVDYGGKRVDDIRMLRERTRRDRRPMIELSHALAALDDLLRTEAKGESLQPLYQAVPEILKGRVELSYDLNNHPNYRLIEPLLYASEFYDPSAQSLMLSLTQGDSRAFALSTPRLEDDKAFNWRMPFAEERVDRLFRLETAPQPWSVIKEIIGPAPGKDELLRSFFTTEKPGGRESGPAQAPRWRYFGHACVLIETGSVNVLVDPSASYRYPSDTPRFTYQDLPEVIDYVLLTHNHQDHVLLETLLRLRHRIKQIVIPKTGQGRLQDPSLKLILRAIGFRNVVEIDEMESIAIPDGAITGLPFLGEHADLDIRTKTAYLVKLGRHVMLFAADSCVHDAQLYEYLCREVGFVDTLFIGMECDGAPLSWLYGPLMPRRPDHRVDQSRRLNGADCAQALAAIEHMRCRNVYIYAMGQEPWLTHVMGVKYTSDSRPIVESNRLLAKCRERGIAAERLFGCREAALGAAPEHASRSSDDAAGGAVDDMEQITV